MAAIISNKGFSHLGLATMDIDATRDFYEGVLGFPVRIADIITVEEGGKVRHIFFDTGRDQLLAFLEVKGVAGVPDTFDCSLNGPIGVPRSLFHIAFEGGSEHHMKAIKARLESKGVTVSEILDHGAAFSMYFRDPVNGLSLEYNTWARPFSDDGATFAERYRYSATKFNDWETIVSDDMTEFAVADR